jgi:hypothetical protein
MRRRWIAPTALAVICLAVFPASRAAGNITTPNPGDTVALDFSAYGGAGLGATITVYLCPDDGIGQ